MVNKCAAFGCRSGYKKKDDEKVSHESHDKITFHSFPLHNKELCDRWLRANPRKDFVPTKHSRLCSLHFTPSDFIEVHADSNKRRDKSRGDKKLAKRYLKDDAVPSVFPSAPSYFSTAVQPPRSTNKATSASRRLLEGKALEDMEASFRQEDDISTLPVADIARRLSSEETVPDGFTVFVHDQTLFVCLMKIADDIPSIRASVSIKPDLSMALSLDGKVVAQNQYKDIVPGRLSLMSQLINLLARVKCWCDQPQTRSQDMLLGMAVKCLKQCLKQASEEHDDSNSNSRKLEFIVEQLRLLQKHKFGRQFSPQLTILCYMIHAASSSAYTTLRDEDVLCLPSVSTLRKITRRVNENHGLDISAYLSLRVSKLNEYERNVVLMIDEIYIAKRVEYSGGEVKGLVADGSVASTLLCFMVKSVVGKYKDLVSIYPVSKLTASKQLECFNEVMTLLRKVLLNVVVISVDNASTNR